MDESPSPAAAPSRRTMDKRKRQQLVRKNMTTEDRRVARQGERQRAAIRKVQASGAAAGEEAPAPYTWVGLWPGLEAVADAACALPSQTSSDGD